MELMKLMHGYNVSTLLVVPSLEKDAKSAKFRGREIEIPLIQLLLEHGLLNSYMYSDDDKSGDYLYLLFDREKVLKKFNLIDHIGYSAVEFVLGLPQFDTLYHMTNDYIVYRLKLETQFKEDYTKIVSSQYSKVSKLYKSLIRSNNAEVIVTKNAFAKDLIKYNIPYSITSKSKYLKKMLEDFYTTKVSDENEYYKTFKTSEETFSRRKTIQKIIKNTRKCQKETSML